MSKKKRSLIEEVEEMAKENEVPEEETKTEYQIDSPLKHLAVRDESGAVLGTITKGAKVVGEFRGDKFYFEYEGRTACIDKKRVRKL